jgi:hypothetical protein
MLSKSKKQMQHFGNLVCDSAINVFSDKGQFIESDILNGYQQIQTFDANLMHDVLSGKAVTGIYSPVPSISGKQTHAHISCGAPSISGKQTHAHISYDISTMGGFTKNENPPWKYTCYEPYTHT